MILLLWLLAGPAWGERITVAVASNFLTTAQDIAAIFSAETGHDVDLVHGSSGKLFAQIRAGAPFDVFLSADQLRPARLVDSGQSVGGARTYAVGRLALVHGARIEPGALEAVLMRPGIRIAIADPAVAPYGAAAREILETNLGPSWQANVVLGESVGQAFTFVATGNADVGLVSLAQARTFQGEIWMQEVATSLHAPIRQDAVLLKRAETSAAAKAFLDFLLGNIAQSLMVDAGYEVIR